MIHLVVTEKLANADLMKGIVLKIVSVKLVSDVEQIVIVQGISHQTIVVAINHQVPISLIIIRHSLGMDLKIKYGGGKFQSFTLQKKEV